VISGGFWSELKSKQTRRCRVCFFLSTVHFALTTTTDQFRSRRGGTTTMGSVFSGAMPGSTAILIGSTLLAGEGKVAEMLAIGGRGAGPTAIGVGSDDSGLKFGFGSTFGGSTFGGSTFGGSTFGGSVFGSGVGAGSGIGAGSVIGSGVIVWKIGWPVTVGLGA
jgi:hypothetical protein